MYEKVREYIKENQMISPGDLVLAGVSGGRDSMAMLHMLKCLSGEWEFCLEVVHVHHGIRGVEADRDLLLVERFCLDYQIPFRSFHYDVPGLSREWKLGMEETGRLVRQKAFEDTVTELEEVPRRIRIALAHNQNDLAETMLHNLARGTGLRGLAGIKPVNENVIRPVLCLERKEIDHYLEENQIPFATDSSNLEDEYTRNRIRHHVLPVLEKDINEKAVSHMAEAAKMLDQADRFLVKCAGELLVEYKQDKGTYLLKRDFFQKEKILQSYAVMEALCELAGKRKDLSMIHVQQILKLWEKQTGRRISLPYGLCAGKEYEGIRIWKTAGEKAAGNKAAGADVSERIGEWALLIPGEQNCPLGSFCTEIFPYFGQKISEKKYTKWLDYDKIKTNLSVRTRRAGDYLFISGDGRRKKISRCMIDDKIPQDQREKIPLVTCETEVLWVVGGRISEKYKITPETKRVLEVRYQGGYEDE